MAAPVSECGPPCVTPLYGALLISDLLQTYLDQDQLHAITLGEDVLWFDVGTPDRLLDASAARREAVNQNASSSR